MKRIVRPAHPAADVIARAHVSLGVLRVTSSYPDTISLDPKTHLSVLLGRYESAVVTTPERTVTLTADRLLFVAREATCVPMLDEGGKFHGWSPYVVGRL